MQGHSTSVIAYLRSLDTIYEIESPTTTIGRGPENALVIQEKSVSWKHGQLDIDPLKHTVLYILIIFYLYKVIPTLCHILGFTIDRRCAAVSTCAPSSLCSILITLSFPCNAGDNT